MYVADFSLSFAWVDTGLPIDMKFKIHFHGLMRSAYDVIVKDATIALSHDSDADISFSDYDDPIDGLLSSKNVEK